MLLPALGLELGHLGLHRPQVLLHGREHLQHLALGPLALLLGLLLGALALEEVAVLLLKSADLLLERGRGRLHGCQLGRERRLGRLLGGPELGERRLMPGLEHGGVVTAGRGAAQAADEPSDDGAEHEAGADPDEQSEQWVHVPSVAGGADAGPVRR